MNARFCIKAITNVQTPTIFLIVVLLLSLASPSSVTASKIDRVLNQNYYFHRERSGIDTYRFINASMPQRSDKFNYSVFLNEGLYELGNGWISPAVPKTVNLTRSYTFVIGIHCGTNGKGKIGVAFAFWRNGQEHALFTTYAPGFIVKGETHWFHQISNRSLTIQKGDRLVVRVHVKVLESGTFIFGLDCTQYPTFINDPQETRYMRSDQHTVNGLSAYKLLTSESSSLQEVTGSSDTTFKIAIRVYIRHSNGTETEVTSGTSVAIATLGSGVDGTYTISADWDCPETALESTDAIKIDVRCLCGSNWQEGVAVTIATFITEQLAATQLDANTWSVYYRVRRDKEYIGSPPWGFYIYNYYFRFGNAGDDSYITGFKWSGTTSKSWHDVTSWNFNLTTRQWLAVSTWNFNLSTRQWSDIALWTLNLSARQWTDMVLWTLNLTTRQWSDIAAWTFNVVGRQWNNIAEWTLKLWSHAQNPPGGNLTPDIIPVTPRKRQPMSYVTLFLLCFVVCACIFIEERTRKKRKKFLRDARKQLKKIGKTDPFD